MSIEQHWYGARRWMICLYPLHLLMMLLVYCRRCFYRHGMLASIRLPVPVIVVGNITVGGTGKTPLVTYVADLLRARGWKPGIISRGYGASAPAYPFVVLPTSDPGHCGDEPLLLKRRTQLPVVVDPDRVRAANKLLELGCDIIISDDGLQHYRLQRDIEISVVDAVLQLGNGWLLPAGPLREPESRLRSVDLRVGNGIGIPVIGELAMTLQLQQAISLNSGESKALSQFKGIKVHAVAGIGHPERFFIALEKAGLLLERHPFPDHYRFTSDDLKWTDAPIMMTEKDAVKCQSLALGNCFYVPVSAEIEPEFVTQLTDKLASVSQYSNV